MKILRFDNSRCVDFLNKNEKDLDGFFWQELLYLSAQLYKQGFGMAVENERSNDRSSYIGNLEKSAELTFRISKEVDKLWDAMLINADINEIRKVIDLLDENNPK